MAEEHGKGITWGGVLKGVVKIAAVIAVGVGIAYGAGALYPDTVGSWIGDVNAENTGVAKTLTVVSSSIAGVFTATQAFAESAFNQIASYADSWVGNGVDAGQVQDVASSLSADNWVYSDGPLTAFTEQAEKLAVNSNYILQSNAHAAGVPVELSSGLQTILEESKSLQDKLSSLDMDALKHDEAALKATAEFVTEKQQEIQHNLTHLMDEHRGILGNVASYNGEIDPNTADQYANQRLGVVSNQIKDLTAQFDKASPGLTQLSEHLNELASRVDLIDRNEAISTGLKAAGATAVAGGIAGYGIGRRGGYNDGQEAGYAQGTDDMGRQAGFVSRVQSQNAFLAGVQEGQRSFAEAIRQQQEQAAKQGRSRGGKTEQPTGAEA